MFRSVANKGGSQSRVKGRDVVHRDECTLAEKSCAEHRWLINTAMVGKSLRSAVPPRRSLMVMLATSVM